MPIPNTELVDFCNQFDLGLHIYQTNNFNIQNCLPNKFFEVIQGRLGIVSNQSCLQMSDYIQRYKCGVVLGDSSSYQMAK